MNTDEIYRETSSNEPQPCHQIPLLYQQVQQQFTGIVVSLLDVLKVLSFFDCVDDFPCIGTLDVTT